MYESTPESEQGSYNYAQKYLERIDTQVIQPLNVAFANDNYKLQYKILMVFYSEVCEWMNKKEEPFYLDLRKKATTSYNIIQNAINRNKRTVPTSAIESLWTLNVQLRKLMHKKGLTMRKMDDPAMALGGKNY